MLQRIVVSVLACLLFIQGCVSQNSFGQPILAYYSGIGLDTVGSGGLNSLSLAFFSPAAMAGSSCDFTNPQTPCLRPAAGAGPSLGLSWALGTINGSYTELAKNSRRKPMVFFAFGGQSEGGAAWDSIFGSSSSASSFGRNCGNLVVAVAKNFGNNVVIGVDLDIEETHTTLPNIGSFISSFRSVAPANTYPILLDALSGFASSGNPDNFKVGILQKYGPAQGGITFVNMMVNNIQSSCDTMSQYWRNANINFIPAGNRVFGFWGENLSAWILKNPGCTDGSSPLFPWMKSNGVGMGIWQWWSGATGDITPIIREIKQ